MTIDYNRIDRIFFADGYRLAENIIKEQPDTENLDELSHGLYHSVDSLIDTLSARVCRDGQPLHCGKGCHWCCSKAVFTNPWEVIHLGRYISRNFSEERIQGILSLLKTKHEVTSQTGLKEMLSLVHFCPLLEEKVCTVYSARPMACRIYLSTDVDSCIREFNNPENPDIFASLIDFPLHAGRMINEGAASWLRERGFHIPEMTLESGLLIVLEQPERITDWLRGDEAFPSTDFDLEEKRILNTYLRKDENFTKIPEE